MSETISFGLHNKPIRHCDFHFIKKNTQQRATCLIPEEHNSNPGYSEISSGFFLGFLFLIYNGKHLIDSKCFHECNVYISLDIYIGLDKSRLVIIIQK